MGEQIYIEHNKEIFQLKVIGVHKIDSQNWLQFGRRINNNTKKLKKKNIVHLLQKLEQRQEKIFDA